jgi:hypothetical protein
MKRNGEKRRKVIGNRNSLLGLHDLSREDCSGQRAIPTNSETPDTEPLLTMAPLGLVLLQQLQKVPVAVVLSPENGSRGGLILRRGRYRNCVKGLANDT